jgi:hypothetical protein
MKTATERRRSISFDKDAGLDAAMREVDTRRFSVRMRHAIRITAESLFARPVCVLMPLVAAEFTHESGPVVRRCQQVPWLRHR